MPDLTHMIMEQAMKFGRTVTIKAADAIASSSAGAPAQLVHIELRPTDGGPGRIVMAPTHATNGRQLQDKDWMHFIQGMAAELNALEPK